MEFQKEWENPSNQAIMRAACRTFTRLSPDERRSIRLVGLWKALRHYNPKTAQFATFLYRVVGNECLTAIRQDKRQRLRGALLYESNIDPDILDGGLGSVVDKRASRPPENVALQMALAVLSPAEQAMLIDRVLGEMTLEEIGSKYGCSKSAADRRLKSILDRTRKAIGVEVGRPSPDDIDTTQPNKESQNAMAHYQKKRATDLPTARRRTRTDHPGG